MRCKGCGYSLWNVPGRTCPECGRGFAPSEFEFRPNTVEFCCAGCGQQYYGTDRSGLPVPREFDCVRCGAPCALDSMVVRLAPGCTDEQAEVFRVPWETRERGRIRAFLATVRDGMTRPARLGKAIAGGTGAGAAWGFVVLMCAVALLPTAIAVDAVIAWVGYMEASGARTGASSLRTSVLEVLGTTALVTLCAAAGLILAVLACAVACFAILRLLRERPSWGSVWASYAYSTAPGVLLAVPCLGPYCGSTPVTVWFIACAIIVLVHATAIASWKVAVAALAPVVVVLLAGGLVIAFAIAPAMQAAATAAAAAAPPAPAVGEGAVPETGTAEVPADADGGADAGTGADIQEAP
jgi:hypothetical protein